MTLELNLGFTGNYDSRLSLLANVGVKVDL